VFFWTGITFDNRNTIFELSPRSGPSVGGFILPVCSSKSLMIPLLLHITKTLYPYFWCVLDIYCFREDFPLNGIIAHRHLLIVWWDRIIFLLKMIQYKASFWTTYQNYNDQVEACWCYCWNKYTAIFLQIELLTILEHHVAQGERARTEWGSQTIFHGCCWHLFNKESWL